jgi:hypothetical protein
MSELEGETPAVLKFDASQRRPTPEDFALMSSAQMEAYIRSIGLDTEVRDALAEYDESRGQT